MFNKALFFINVLAASVCHAGYVDNLFAELRVGHQIVFKVIVADVDFTIGLIDGQGNYILHLDFLIGEHIIFNDCEAPCQQFDATRQITYINEIKYLYLVGLNKIRLYYKTESTFEVYINNRMFTVPNRLRPGREVTKYKLSGSLTQYEEMCMDTLIITASDEATEQVYLPEKLDPGKKLSIKTFITSHMFRMQLSDDDGNIVFWFDVFRNLMTLNYCVAPCHKVDPSTKVILYRDVGEKIKTFEENRFGFYYVSPRRLLLTINDVWKFYLNVNIKEGIKMTKFKITGYANLQYVCMNLIN